jgi:hypothetical protein
MKKILLSFLAGILLVFAFPYITRLSVAPKSDLFKQGISAEQTFYNHTVDTKLVIGAIKEQAQIVGMSGEFSKSYGYQDAIYDSGWNWLNKLGDRDLTFDVKGTFKMGINIKDIPFDRIRAEGDTVFIPFPSLTLISFELPYDQIVINKHVGVLRKDFSEQDRQAIYKGVKDKAEKEIKADTAIQKEADANTKQAIELLLLHIPNVKHITWEK